MGDMSGWRGSFRKTDLAVPVHIVVSKGEPAIFAKPYGAKSSEGSA
jgi:hypothetical protein